ncbi:hypothetical protein E2C01_057223 [Portunus trituberculatus]|uniref:Uncharacterized protein n=1 Tax=Portunus trituberculatus TaxID=210409 RepID=A0A5B7GZR9_PORTR|nr:hypothetical protein [Portunus trituberculatus]
MWGIRIVKTGYQPSDLHRPFLMSIEWSNHTQSQGKNVSQ